MSSRSAVAAVDVQRHFGMRRVAVILLGACFAVGHGVTAKDPSTAPQSLVQVSAAAKLVRRSSLVEAGENGGDRHDVREHRQLDSQAATTLHVQLDGRKINEFLVAWMKSMGAEDIFPWADKFGVVSETTGGKEAFGFALTRQLIFSIHSIVERDILNLDATRCGRLSAFLVDFELDAWDGVKEWFGILADSLRSAKEKHCKAAGGPACGVLDALDVSFTDAAFFVHLLAGLSGPQVSADVRNSAQDALAPGVFQCSETGRLTLHCLLMDFKLTVRFRRSAGECGAGAFASTGNSFCNCFSSIPVAFKGPAAKCAPLSWDAHISTICVKKPAADKLFDLPWDAFFEEAAAIPFQDRPKTNTIVAFYPRLQVNEIHTSKEPLAIHTESVASIAMYWIALNKNDLSNAAVLQHMPISVDCDKDITVTFLSNVLSGFEEFWGKYPAKSIVAWLERTHMKVKVFSMWLRDFQRETIGRVWDECMSRIKRVLDLGNGALEAAGKIQDLRDRQGSRLDYSKVKWDFLAEWSFKPCDASNRNEMIEYASVIEEGLAGHEEAGADALKAFCTAKKCFSAAAPNTVCSCSKLLLQRLLKEELSESMDSCGQQMTSACILKTWSATRKKKSFEKGCSFPKELIAEALGELLSSEVDMKKATMQVDFFCGAAS